MKLLLIKITSLLIFSMLYTIQSRATICPNLSGVYKNNQDILAYRLVEVIQESCNTIRFNNCFHSPGNEKDYSCVDSRKTIPLNGDVVESCSAGAPCYREKYTTTSDNISVQYLDERPEYSNQYGSCLASGSTLFLDNQGNLIEHIQVKCKDGFVGALKEFNRRI